jgi:hypothetical protein
MRAGVGEFHGAEPLVGEIVGLRTFRVDESGLLLPLYSSQTWYDGVNVAVCAPPTGDRAAAPHAVPADDCECGFYAYGDIEAGAQNRQFHYVQAVVSCWGGVLAGTRGVRAQYARIDALWLHPNAPAALRRRVAARYPSARMYADAVAMRVEHPPSRLACYERAEPRPRAGRVAGGLGFLAVLALGVLPVQVLRGIPVLEGLWVLAIAATILLAGWLAVGARSLGHLAAAVVVAGVLAWLLAPLLGLAGWLLRVPLLRALAGGGWGYLSRLRPHYFPVVKVPRERSFCGVTP